MILFILFGCLRIPGVQNFWNGESFYSRFLISCHAAAVEIIKVLSMVMPLSTEVVQNRFAPLGQNVPTLVNVHQALIQSNFDSVLYFEIVTL